MDDDKRSVAIEELKLLSAIIGRIEGTIFQRHAWLFSLITALALALFNKHPLICKQPFLFISSFTTIVFWITDAIQRVPVHRAIERSKIVEEALRKNSYLCTPLISDELSNGKNFVDFLHCAFRLRVWIPIICCFYFFLDSSLTNHYSGAVPPSMNLIFQFLSHEYPAISVR